jgi:hypothetical protein
MVPVTLTLKVSVRLKVTKQIQIFANISYKMSTLSLHYSENKDARSKTQIVSYKTIFQDEF